jgi:hypothetical protein
MSELWSEFLVERSKEYEARILRLKEDRAELTENCPERIVPTLKPCHLRSPFKGSVDFLSLKKSSPLIQEPTQLGSRGRRLWSPIDLNWNEGFSSDCLCDIASFL